MITKFQLGDKVTHRYRGRTVFEIINTPLSTTNGEYRIKSVDTGKAISVTEEFLSLAGDYLPPVTIPKGHTAVIKGDKIFFERVKLYRIEEIIKEEKRGLGWEVHSVGPRQGLLSEFGYHYRDLASEHDARRAAAFMQATRIASYYNRIHGNNWTPDWKSGDQPKYIIIRNSRGDLVVDSYREINTGGIYFATRELAEIALENNREIFETLLS